MDTNRILVERAAEPQDVFWENLGYDIVDRAKRGFATFSITALILIVVFGVNLGLNYLKEVLEESSRD